TAVTSGTKRLEAARAKTAAAKPPSATPAAPPAKAPVKDRMSLADFIIKLMREAGGPMTVKQITQEVKRRRFPTTSNNVPRLIGTRTAEMKKKGILLPAPGQNGFVLPRRDNGRKSVPRPAAPPLKGTLPFKAPKLTKPVKPAKKGTRSGQLPLRVMLTNILQRSPRPLNGAELARKVIESGYRTSSKDFAAVVYVMLGKMENIENVPGAGYRLKKGRG